jgi:hypothetical protein
MINRTWDYLRIAATFLMWLGCLWIAVSIREKVAEKANQINRIEQNVAYLLEESRANSPEKK